jgi:DNA-directed RNA polymerase III subunit RPC3
MDMENQLAEFLIETHFGQFVKKVCSLLLSAGPQTSHEIQQKCKFDENVVRESLLVGLQHNFIYVSQISKTSRYHIIVDSIITRVRYPQFILMVREVHSDEAEIILRELITQGKATTEHLVAHALDYYSVMPDFNRKEKELALGKICNALIASKTITPVAQFIEKVIVHGKQLAGNGDMTKKRAREDQEEEDAVSKKSRNNNQKGKTNTADFKNELDKERMGSEVQEIIPIVNAQKNDLANPYWCLNTEELNYFLEKKLCLEMVAQITSPKVAGFVRELFHLVEEAYGSGKNKNWAEGGISESAICKRIQAQIEGIEKAEITASLDVLVNDRSKYLNKIFGKKRAKYCINFPGMLHSMKRLYIESVIVEKYGVRSLRIFRLISIKKNLEMQQVADLAMMTLKEARERLYTMLHDNMLHLQEISKTANHLPTSTFYFFSVRHDKLSTVICKDVYQAMYNILKRSAFEIEQVSALISLSNEENRLRATNPNAVIMTEEERTKLKHAVELQERMLNSVHKLDLTLCALKFDSDDHAPDYTDNDP